MTNEALLSLATILFLGALLLFGNLLAAAVILIVAAISAMAYNRGWLAAGWGVIGGWLRRRQSAVTASHRPPGTVRLAYTRDTQEPIYLKLSQIQAMLLAGTSGFGKTVTGQEIIDDILTQFRPAQVRLALGSLKRSSISPWRNLPHLIAPIAVTQEEHSRLIRTVLDEMRRRERMFEPYQDYFVEGLDDYAKLSGQAFPEIVLYLDELADTVMPGTQAYSDLITLVKVGRYVGIYPIVSTQRPSAKVLSGELLSQIVTKMFMFMPNSREFGLVSMIPERLYAQAQPVPGLVMMYTTPRQWEMAIIKKTSRLDMARRAAKMGGRPRRWPQTEAPAPTTWRGDDAQKVSAITMLGKQLNRRPKIAEIMTHFGISKTTAIKYRKMAYKDA